MPKTRSMGVDNVAATLLAHDIETLPTNSALQAYQVELQTRRRYKPGGATWVVVKIMVPFWVF